MRTDDYGLLVGYNDNDSGDTAFFHAHYSYCSKLLNKSESNVASYPYALEMLWDESNNAIRRTPNKDHWGFNSGNSTRDQHIGHIICLGKDMYNDTKTLKKIFWRLFTHFGFYPNILKNYTNEKKRWYKLEFPDIATPDNAGIFIRSFNIRSLWLALIISDCALALAVIYRLIHVRFIDQRDVDDANTNIALMQAKRVMPTPISWLTRKLWKHLRFRGHAWANSEYFSAARNSAVGLDAYWIEVIRREF